MIFGPPSPRVAHSFFKSPPRLDGRTASLAFAVDDLAVIHTFASMAGRTQGQSLAAQPVIGKLCALARVTSVGNLSSAARIEQGLVEGGSLHGIPGQNIEVHRLRGRLRLHGRGTAVLSRQAVQK